MDSLIIREPGLLVRERWCNEFFPRFGIPRTEVHMGGVIFLGDRVCSDNHIHPVFFLNKPGKIGNPGAGGISDDQTGGKVDDLRTIVLHLLWRILDISAWTPVAARKSDKFDLSAAVPLKGAFAVAQCPQTFSPVQDRYLSQIMIPSFTASSIVFNSFSVHLLTMVTTISAELCLHC